MAEGSVEINIDLNDDGFMASVLGAEKKAAEVNKKISGLVSDAITGVTDAFTGITSGSKKAEKDLGNVVKESVKVKNDVKAPLSEVSKAVNDAISGIVGIGGFSKVISSQSGAVGKKIVPVNVTTTGAGSGGKSADGSVNITVNGVSESKTAYEIYKAGKKLSREMVW